MNKITVIAPKTAAESTGVVIDTSQIKSSKLIVLADNLAGAEEVDLEIYAGAETYKVWISNSAGAYKLTATQYMLELTNPGCLIRVKKDVTSSACGVIIAWPNENKRGG